MERINNFLFVYSWIIVSLLIGISYLTVYTSFLMKPNFSVPIDTMDQFIENGSNLF